MNPRAIIFLHVSGKHLLVNLMCVFKLYGWVSAMLLLFDTAVCCHLVRSGCLGSTQFSRVQISATAFALIFMVDYVKYAIW